MRLFVFVLFTLHLAICAFSTERQFRNIFLGQLEPSSDDFPFLQPTGSAGKVLVYPSSVQMIGLIVDALDSENSMDKNFELFESFRRYFGQYLNSNFRQRSPVTLPKGIQVEQQMYSFAPIIVTETEISNIANYVLREEESLPEIDGSREAESSQSQQAVEEHARYPVNFPKANAVQELRSCSRNQGNTGTVDFKILEEGVTEFTSYRVSCLRVKSHFFAAISMVQIVYRKASQKNGANDGHIRRSVQSFADYMLRDHVANNFRYPYMVDIEKYWTAIPAATDSTTTEVDQVDDESTSTERPPAATREGETPRHAIENNGISTFSGRLKYGQKIVVRGTPTESAARFIVNLNQGNGYIGLHFSVRFDDPKDGRVVVRNVMRESEWEQGKEERDGTFPFERNEPFKLTISCEDDAYKIEVNNQPFASFKHRLVPTEVDSVSVEGDVKNVIVADVHAITL